MFLMWSIILNVQPMVSIHNVQWWKIFTEKALVFLSVLKVIESLWHVQKPITKVKICYHPESFLIHIDHNLLYFPCSVQHNANHPEHSCFKTRHVFHYHSKTSKAWWSTAAAKNLGKLLWLLTGHHLFVLYWFGHVRASQKPSLKIWIKFIIIHVRSGTKVMSSNFCNDIRWLQKPFPTDCKFKHWWQ